MGNRGVQMLVEYVDHMGDDLRVVNAARVSFNKESALVECCTCSEPGGIGCGSECTLGLCDGDKRLIRYLARNGHWTPFSHPMVTMRETVPIFVARQRFKHMVGFTYNEVSRRYVSDTPEFFSPIKWRGKPTDGAKQGSSGDVIKRMRTTTGTGETYSIDIEYAYSNHLEESVAVYTDMLDAGVAPEQARMVLPQSMLTSYYVTGSLYAWANAYKQRVDGHAQKEIQTLAHSWGTVLEPLFPSSWPELVGG